jgi:hypothetical protein
MKPRNNYFIYFLFFTANLCNKTHLKMFSQTNNLRAPFVFKKVKNHFQVEV